MLHTSPRGIRTGIDRLAAREINPGLDGARLGLITNDLALTGNLRRGRVALIEAGFNLTLLFAPEHGIAGTAREGAQIGDIHDPITGLPVRSLYGEQLAPAAADLAAIDTLIFDLPDIGARFYTYMWTLSYALEACAAAGVRVVVLDRPNPLGGDLTLAEGPMLDEEHCRSFVGRWPMPIRHQATIGELARHWVESRGITVDLTVIECTGWEREQIAAATPAHWTPTSPAMPDALTALLYPGTCLLEGVNLSEGRGTAAPFRVFGAPWLDSEATADALNALGLPGVGFIPYGFTPMIRNYAGEPCSGVMLAVTDLREIAPVHTMVRALEVVHALHPGRLTERVDPSMAGGTDATALEHLFGIPGAFRRITAGEFRDPASLATPDWPGLLGDAVLY